MSDPLDVSNERALAGDMGAARLLLEHAVPALRPCDMAQAPYLPEGTLTEQGRAVLALVVAADDLASALAPALLGATISGRKACRCWGKA